MRHPIRHLALLLLLALPGCTPGPAGTTTIATVDAGPTGPDLACAPKECVADKDEDCAGCFHHIGECCYGDKNWKVAPVTLNGLVNACTDIPRCASCCNECKALSCAEIIRRGNCPFDMP